MAIKWEQVRTAWYTRTNDWQQVERCLEALQAELAVAFGEEPRLIATIEGPAGRLDLA